MRTVDPNDKQPTIVQSCNELSERERNVLKSLVEGKTRGQIAHELGLAQHTIEVMLSNTSGDRRAIYRKIGVTSLVQAIVWFKDHCPQDNTDPKTLSAEGDPKHEISLRVESPELPNEIGRVPERMPSLEPEPRPIPWTFIASFVTLSICVILLIFVPTHLRGGTDLVDSILLNLYAVIPAMAGIYGLRYFHAQSRFIRTFGLFSVGLILWAIGGVVWLVYDVTVGLEPHYGSLVELGFVSQTMLQLVSFAIWWWVVSKRGQFNSFIWLPIAAALIMLYSVTLVQVRSLQTGTEFSAYLSALDVVNILGDTISLSLAICLSWHTKFFAPRMRIVMSLMVVGLGLFFFSGLSYMVTISLPPDHRFFYPAGGWVDTWFAIAFVFWGLGIAVARSVDNIFLDED